MATTTEHIAARSDGDLVARAIATAEAMGIPNASNWVQQNMGLIIGVEVQDGQSIADVYAYALNVRNQQLAAIPPSPGANLAAVTDTHLSDAISLLLSPTE